MDVNLPIPSQLNRILVVFVVAANVALLLTASRFSDSLPVVIVCAVMFSYLMLTDYALIHEAVHWKLQANKKWNYALGVIVSALFPLPFTLTATTHYSHHERNRTDTEMFDLYYEGDQRWLKRAQWYSIMTGLFWIGSTFGSMLFALFPFMVRLPPFSTARTSSHLSFDLSPDKIRRIQLEALAIVAVFGAGFYFDLLKWQPTLILYAAFGFNWSTRIYISHAFTSRHIIEGTDNLRQSPIMTWILLHGEWDLNHHRYPQVPWVYLPTLAFDEQRRVPYLKKYFSLWRGPRLTNDQTIPK